MGYYVMQNRGVIFNCVPAALSAVVLMGAMLSLSVDARAEGDPAAYKAAVPALEEAGGGKACVECFLEKYGPAEFNKVFAVSKDGAYGGRWKKGQPMANLRDGALMSCRKKPAYNPENPCVIFFENDQLVWKP